MVSVIHISYSLISSATKIAAILEDERKETKPTGPIRADDHRQTHHHQPGSGSRDTGNVQEVKQGGFNHTGGASGYSPSPYNAPTDTSFNSTVSVCLS